MQAFQFCMPRIIVHPPPREATLLQLCTPNFHGKYKGNPIFVTIKCPSIMHSPAGEASIMQVQTNLGGLHLGESRTSRETMRVKSGVLWDYGGLCAEICTAGRRGGTFVFLGATPVPRGSKNSNSIAGNDTGSRPLRAL